MKQLRGKTALLTGASRGIGVYVARALAKQGMNLVLAARSEAPLLALQAELEAMGVEALAVPTDVHDPAALRALVAAAEAAFGRVDVLINNAGVEEVADFADTDFDSIDRVIRINLLAPMQLSHLLLPKMIAQGAGHIVNIASLAGLTGVAYSESYAASKHGMMGFTRSLRLTVEGEGYPVGVSVVCPGLVSDVGMYVQWQDEAALETPAAYGISTPQVVADAVIDAIVNNRPETIVNPRPIKPAMILLTMFPSLSEWVGHTFGGIRELKKLSDKRKASG
jgi:short-subunit dehydrogenase